MTCLNKISKPHIVDLLRMFDKRKFVTPRIRYASVRSKPELIEDIERHFYCAQKENHIYFERVSPSRSNCPSIVYDLEHKEYIFNGRVMDVPKESREVPKFQIFHGPFLVQFDRILAEARPWGGRYWVPCPPELGAPQGLLIPEGQLATRISSASSEVFRAQGIRSPSDLTGPCEPSTSCGSTPRLKLARRLSWGS